MIITKIDNDGLKLKRIISSSVNIKNYIISPGMGMSTERRLKIMLYTVIIKKKAIVDANSP